MISVDVFKESNRSKFYSLKFPFDQELKDKINSLEKREWDSSNRCWRVPAIALYDLILLYKGRKDIFFKFETPELRDFFIVDYKKGLIEREQYNVERDNYFIRKKAADQYIQLYENDSTLEVEYPEGLREGVIPFRHQLIGGNLLNIIGSGLLAMDMGTGKSLAALIATLYNKDIKKVFIICPASLKLNWKNEVEKFTYEKAHVLKYKDNLYTIDESKFIITNYEFFSSGKFNVKKQISSLGLDNIDTLILDESHRVANTQSNTSKNIGKSFKKLDHIFLLSGTPIKARLEDIYSQLHMIAPYEFKTKSFFMEKFCGVRYENNMWIQIDRPKPDLMYQDLRGLMYRKMKSEVLDLPKVNYSLVDVELTPTERKEYDQIFLEKKEIEELDISSETEYLPMVQLIAKLRQFLGKVKAKHTISLCKELNNSGKKVVIFDYFKKPLYEIEKGLDKVALYTGDVDPVDRQSIVDKFQEDNNELMNIAASIKAGNSGITLTRSNYMLMNNISYIPAENDQCYARIDRIGQIEPCTVVIFRCLNTIDELIYEIGFSRTVLINKAINNIDYVDAFVQAPLTELINYINR